MTLTPGQSGLLLVCVLLAITVGRWIVLWYLRVDRIVRLLESIDARLAAMGPGGVGLSSADVFGRAYATKALVGEPVDAAHTRTGERE